jgi:hypothetical protein
MALCSGSAASTTQNMQWTFLRWFVQKVIPFTLPFASIVAVRSAEPVPGPPKITSVAPSTAVLGEPVFLFGDNLGETTEVRFNGLPAAFQLEWDNRPGERFLATVVPLNATSGPITVTTPLGTATTGLFVVNDGKPVITSVSPASGYSGNALTIYGTNLKYVTSVQFNGREAQFGLGIDPVNIHLLSRIPDGATTGPITVTGPWGSFTTQAAFTILEYPPLVVKQWPREATAGSSLILSVNDNSLVTDVQLNGAHLTFLGFGAPSLIITFPVDATTGTLMIFTRNGVLSSPEPVTIRSRPPQPALSRVQPDFGGIGTRVYAQGTDLEGVTHVQIANTNAEFDPGTSSFTVPVGARSGSIQLITSLGTYGTSFRFQVIEPRGGIISRAGTIRTLDPDRAAADPQGSAPQSTGTESSVATRSRGRSVSAVGSSAQVTLQRTRGGVLELFWPGAASEGVLETTDNLAGGHWLPVLAGPSLDDGQKPIVLRPASGQGFFRVRGQPPSR